MNTKPSRFLSKRFMFFPFYVTKQLSAKCQESAKKYPYEAHYEKPNPCKIMMVQAFVVGELL